MTYWDQCCGGCCIDRYDACCDRCCPCISHDARDITLNCCTCFLAVAVLAAVALLLAAFSRARLPSIAVHDASLTAFAVVTTTTTSPTTAATLTYNLSLTVAVRNPSWAMAMTYTQPLQAGLSFGVERLAHFDLAGEGESQRAGKTRVYHLASGGGGVAEFRKENASGVFRLEVALAGEARYTLHVPKRRVTAICVLNVQLAPPGTSPAPVFESVKCKPEQGHLCGVDWLFNLCIES